MIQKHPLYNYGINEQYEVYNLITLNKKRPSFNKGDGYYYFNIHNNKKIISYRLHRFIWECLTQTIIDKNMEIDHIDRNKMNNNISNLRLVTKSQNSHNQSNKHAKSGYKGAFYTPVKKCVNGKTYEYDYWTSKIMIEGNLIILGRYKSSIDAAKAYDNYVYSNELSNIITTNKSLGLF